MFEYDSTDLQDQLSPLEQHLFNLFNPDFRTGQRNPSKGNRNRNQSHKKKHAIFMKQVDDKYYVEVLVPGFDNSQLKVNYDTTKNNLIILGDMYEGKENNDENIKASEKSEKEGVEECLINEHEEYCYFRRELPLSDDVLADKITAKLDKGILKIIVPREANKKMQAISIS